MPNTGPKSPAEPIPVLVRDEKRPTMWSYGLMSEWRWVHEEARVWEALVMLPPEDARWVPGSRLKRVSTSIAEQAAVRAATG